MISRRANLIALATGMSFGAVTSACARDVQANRALSGRWGGFLSLGANGLRLVLDMSIGQPITLVSVDQGNTRIVATDGASSVTTVSLTFATINARLVLALDRQGSLVGEFTQGAVRPISFARLAPDAMPVRPTPKPFGTLQSEIDAALLRSGAPAYGVAFMANKEERKASGEAAGGVLVAGETTPVTQGLKWHVGSITKSMTATLVARLIERGLVTWGTTLGTAFSDIAPNMSPQYRNVTLSQLMTGRSGMPTNIATPEMIGHFATDQSPNARRKIWAQQALAMPPESAVGARFVYPNNGYVLAGTLCEMLTGKAYEVLIQDEVFAPLGLTTCGFGPPSVGNPQGHRKAIIGSRAIAVGIDAGADNPAAMSPAGRAHMSLTDLAKFGLAHAEGHQGRRNDFLKQETWQLLHTPPVRTPSGNDYAYGWIARPDGTLWHNGSNTYWLAELAFDSAKSVSACACANVAGTEDAVGRLLAAGLAQAASS